MTFRRDDGPGHGAEAAWLSRAEIETICILHSIGSGCDLHELTERLGLPRELAPIVAEAVAELVAAGDIATADDFVELSTAGRARLDGALSRLGPG